MAATRTRRAPKIDRAGTPENLAREITGSILSHFGTIEMLRRSRKKALLLYMMEGYASANYGHDCDQNTTLDDADILMAYMVRLARDLGIDEFSYQTIETEFSSPPEKDETPDQRAGKMIARAPSSPSGISGMCEVKGVAASLAQLHRGSKRGQWWAQVASIISTKITAAAARYAR